MKDWETSYTYPNISTATTIEITGISNAGDIIEVFANDDASCPGFLCQGKNYLGNAVADASGNWSLSGTFSPGARVIATATDGNNNTSEFSNCLEVIECTDIWYLDADDDSFGNPDVSQIACIQPPNYVANNQDCDDAAPAIRKLAREMGVRLLPGRAALVPALSQCVLAARAYGLAVLDGTFNDLTDWKGFDAECQQGRDLGMDGKTLIHPRQVPIANEAFAPSNEEVEWAEKVLAAFDRPENHEKAVIAVEGQMVERMHERMALRVIETATAILPDD